MSASRDGSSLGVRGWQKPATEDHTQLLAWYAEQDAERAPLPSYCACFVDDGRGGCEYDPAGCPEHAETLGRPA